MSAGIRNGESLGGIGVSGELCENLEIRLVTNLAFSDKSRGPGTNCGLRICRGLGQDIVGAIPGTLERPQRRQARFEIGAGGKELLQATHDLVITAFLEQSLGGSPM